MKIKSIIISLFCVIAILLVWLYNNKIVNFIAPLFKSTPAVITKDANIYRWDYDFKFVQRTDNFTPYGYQDMLNMIYTILNNGYDKITFYCPEEYELCLTDLESISIDNTLLTNINNFVHPYNNFINMKTTYDNTGEITITITKLYTDQKILEINQKVDEILKKIITNDMTDEEKIRKIHNYIIENTTYDVNKNNTGISIYDANTAYGTIIENHSVCGGYSDAMAIFLNKLNIKNYKIASVDHVWNAVYINNKWAHLDLTWDDPVGISGEEYLLQKYFLINNQELQNLDSKSHNFDKYVYQEFK